MKTFKQFYEDNSMEYHYTIIGIGGYHSENIIVLKSFGHVPDQKVEGLVKYSTQLANEQFGEDEDYQGEYEDYVEFGTADAMSNFYHDVGIDEAVGEYHINEQYKLVKHIPPHRPITAGDANFEGDEMFFIRTLDGWDGSVNEAWKPGDLGVHNWGEYESGGRHAELGAIEPHMEKTPGPDRVVAHMNGLQNEYMRVLKSRKSNPDVKDNYKYVRDNIDQAIQMMNQTTGRKTESGRNITQDIYIAGVAARSYMRTIEAGESNQAYYKNLLNHLLDAADAMEGLIEQEAEGELGGWNVNENFKDGKKKGKSRPGRVKKAGTSCNGSVTELRKRAKNSSGEKAKMSHWCANMKSGKSK